MKNLVVKSVILLCIVIFHDVEAQVITLRGTEYSNNSLVRMKDIGEDNEALICSTDLRPCCGTPPNRYGEWYYPNGSNLRPIGSTDPLYRNRLDDGTVRLHRRSAVLIPVDGRYRCTIPNNQGVMVHRFVYILHETSIPNIARHPEHRFNSDPGSTVTLSVVTVNVKVYQWQVNDSDIDESSKYVGTRTSTLTIHNILEQDEGFYSCIVSNQFLTVVSNRAAVTVLNPPIILENPGDQLGIEEGSTVMFSVIVVGIRLSFDWMFQNSSQLATDENYAGQNTSILTVYSASQHVSASYQCQVSNAAGVVISHPARLSVMTNKLIEMFVANPGVTSVKLTWTFAEDAQATIYYFYLKYFPLLFPSMVIMVNTTNMTYEAIGLVPQTTYLFELQPIVGDKALQAMSKEVMLEKLPPVENVSVEVNSVTSVHVSWNVYRELIGWNLNFLYYNLYYNAHSRNGLHSIHRMFEVNNTYVNIAINHLVLEEDWQHQFEVSAVLVTGIEGLETIENEKSRVALKMTAGGALFQLLLGPTDYCIQWNVEKARRFQHAIRQKIASVLSDFCDCDFPVHLIDDGVFSCRTFDSYVIYRSKITGLFASSLIQYLLEWVEVNPSLRVDWLLLNVYSSCSTIISSIDEPDCNTPFNFTEKNITEY